MINRYTDHTWMVWEMGDLMIDPCSQIRLRWLEKIFPKWWFNSNLPW